MTDGRTMVEFDLVCGDARAVYELFLKADAQQGDPGRLRNIAYQAAAAMDPEADAVAVGASGSHAYCMTLGSPGRDTGIRKPLGAAVATRWEDGTVNLMSVSPGMLQRLFGSDDSPMAARLYSMELWLGSPYQIRRSCLGRMQDLVDFPPEDREEEEQP